MINSRIPDVASQQFITTTKAPVNKLTARQNIASAQKSDSLENKSRIDEIRVKIKNGEYRINLGETSHLMAQELLIR